MTQTELIEHYRRWPLRPVGVCKIPPRGLTFWEYRALRDGPLVECRYKTARYPRPTDPIDNWVTRVTS